MGFIMVLIGIVVVVGIAGNIAQSNDILSKIMLFSGFLIIVGAITSNFFRFMSVITNISALVLIGVLVIKVFQKIFIK